MRYLNEIKNIPKQLKIQRNVSIKIELRTLVSGFSYRKWEIKTFQTFPVFLRYYSISDT